MGNPVNVSNDGINCGLLTVLYFSNLGVEVGSFELGVVEGTELVQSHLVGLGGVGVVLLDDLEILKEDESSVGVFFIGVDDVELLLPLEEAVALLLDGVEDGRCEEDCCYSKNYLLIHFSDYKSIKQLTI